MTQSTAGQGRTGGADTRVTIRFPVERTECADGNWQYCERPGGSHDAFRMVGTGESSDLVLSYGTPIPLRGKKKIPRLERWSLKWRGVYTTEKLRRVWQALESPKDRTFCMFYEPPTFVSDEAYAVAKEFCARVYGPDPRATHPIRLPATWLFERRVDELRTLRLPEERPMALAAVVSGKAILPGHRERLGFVRRVRAAGVPLELFGSAHLPGPGSQGMVRSTGNVYSAARLTLSVENYAGEDLYVSEKLWEPLLLWSVPLYYGSKAADAMIPSEAFIRLPDLGEGGVEAIRAALADEKVFERRRDAIAEARRRILDDLHMGRFIEREILSTLPPARTLAAPAS